MSREGRKWAGSRQSRGGSDCGSAKLGKAEMARPPSSGPVLPCWHPRRHPVIPKCPRNAAWPRQNVTTLNQNVRYLNRNVRFFSVNLFCCPLFSIGYQLCSEFFFFRPSFLSLEARNSKLETGNSKLEVRDVPIGNRQSKIGNLYSAPGGPASCEYFAEPMGIGTWRSRGRACQGRPGASRAYPTAPFRAEATPSSGTASNFYAVI